jgi:hypothetical protein
MECKREKNQATCACPSDDCPRHGVCCECVAFHKAKGQLPVCLRSLFEDQETQQIKK